MKKIGYLDALRGLAIIAVIIVHTNQHGIPVEGFFKPFINNGARGVQLFFMTSAFTLFLSRDRRIEKNEIRNFFIRRFFRIAPLFYVGIIYYLWQNGFGPRYFLGDIKEISLSNIISTFTFTNSFNPYWINSIVPGGWSIAIEFLFYALLPVFIFKFIKNLNTAFVFFIGSILLSFVCNLYLSKNQLIPESVLWKEYLYMYFPSQLPVFVMGIICYYLIIKDESLKAVNSVSIFILCALTIIQISASYIFFQDHILFSLAFALLTFALSIRSSKLFVNPFTLLIGKISFSLYLCHFAVLYWLEKFDLVNFTDRSLIDYGIRFLLVFSISSVVAYLTYRFIEKPFIKIGENIIRRN